MSTRHRVKSNLFESGGTQDAVFFGTPQPHSIQTITSQFKYSSTCDDFISVAGDQPLTIERYVNQAVPLSGVTPNATNPTRVMLDKWYATNQMDQGAHLTLPSLPLFDAAAFLASVNPNASQVGMPENIKDFKDIPKLIQLSGNTILKRGAGAYLNYEFGWKPLISDVKKLLDFTGRVNKKVNELHALYQNGGIHRMRVVSKDSASSSGSVTLTGFTPSGPTCKTSKFTTRKRWATTRFVPTTLPPKDESDYRRRAVQIVLGFDLSPSTMWSLIPWSWLVDWFSNVGDYLVQFNNTCPVRASPPCVMTHTQTIEVWTRSDAIASMLGGSRILQRDTKLRSVAVPTLSASIPFLTNRQLSILGALSVTRHVPSHR